MGTLNMQITSDRPGVAELAPTDEQIRTAMSKPSATQEFAALCKTALEGSDRDRKVAYARLRKLLRPVEDRKIDAATVTYVSHLSGGCIRVILSDGRHAEMNPVCFPTLR